MQNKFQLQFGFVPTAKSGQLEWRDVKFQIACIRAKRKITENLPHGWR